MHDRAYFSLMGQDFECIATMDAHTLPGDKENVIQMALWFRWIGIEVVMSWFVEEFRNTTARVSLSSMGTWPLYAIEMKFDFAMGNPSWIIMDQHDNAHPHLARIVRNYPQQKYRCSSMTSCFAWFVANITCMGWNETKTAQKTRDTLGPHRVGSSPAGRMNEHPSTAKSTFHWL